MARIRVLLVDDSVVIRKMVGDILAEDPDIEVVGTAVNGRIALQKIEQLAPDVVTMDIEMPEMDGIEAVRRLRASGNRVPIIMFSTLTEHGAIATLDALAAGASDYVSKPANMGSVGRSIEQIRGALVPRIRALTGRLPAAPATAARSVDEPAPVVLRRPAPVVLRRPATAVGGHRLLVVGCSTGGPEALSTFLGALPELPVPVAVVQHMPPVFTRQLAARLDRQVASHVVEAENGVRLVPGTIYIAPGDHHLQVAGNHAALVTRLSQEPPVNYCRPAVDVLFSSAARVAGGAVLGVVLTGMGQDGCAGSRDLVDQGAGVLVQDRASSVVWGMPGAVATAGLAEEVLPLDQLAQAVVRRLVPQRLRPVAGGATR